MNITKSNENYIAALVMAVAVCFSFFAFSVSAVQAEEETDTEEESTTDFGARVSMMKQIESLRAMIAERKASLKEKINVVKEERKAEFRINKDDFMASLDDLEEDDKRATMIAFIADIRVTIEAKKAEHAQNKEAIKEERKEIKAEFKNNLEGLNREQKIAAILERITAIKAQIEERAGTDSDDDDDIEDDSDDDESDLDDDLEEEDEDES